MQKIPVLAVLRATYGFVFENYLRILGVIWVPMALIFALMLWQMVPFMAAMDQPGAAQNPQVALASMGHVLIFEAGAFVLLTLMTVGVTRMALGLEIRFPLFYFPLGGDFGRLLLAFFLVFLIFLGIMIVVWIALGAVLGIMAASMAGPNADPAQVAVEVQKFTPVILVVTYAVLFVIFIRFAMLLPAIAIREKQLGIGRNWTLTRGNFFRLLGVLIGVLLPFLVLGVLMFAVIGILGGPSANVLGALGGQAQQLAWSQHMFGLYATYWYIFFPLWFLLAPAYYGAALSAGAFAYRALEPGAEPAEAFT